MKRKISLLILIVLMISLCGCGKVSQAEEAIAALGEVTPLSGEEIGNIQLLLDEMSDSQTKRVQNLQEFKRKKLDFERMCELLNEADRAIEAIGTVTPDSGEKVAAARKAWDELAAEDLTEYLENQYAKLEAAENQYGEMTRVLTGAREAIEAIGTVTLDSEEAITAAQLAVEEVRALSLEGYLEEQINDLTRMEQEFRDMELHHFYECALIGFSNGDCETGNSYLVKLKTRYPSSQEAAKIEGEAVGILVQVASQEMGDQSYCKADEILNYCQLNYYQSVSKSGDYKTIRENLDKKLKDLRPATRKVFHNSIKGGYGQLVFTAETENDILVRLVSVKDSTKYMLFYVRAGEKTTVSVEDGEYYIRYLSGKVWYGEKDLFGSGENYSQFDNTAAFKTKFSGNTVTYSKINAKVTD